METVVRQPEPQEEASADVARRLWTIADLAALPDQLPTGPAVYELWDGELRLMSPPGDFHGSVMFRLGTALTVHGEWEGHGRVSGGDAGVVIQPESPQTALGADVVFLAADQLPARHSKEGYLLTIPALVAEVRSKNDRQTEVEAKVARYLAAGVRVVWVADPGRRTVTVHRSGQTPEVLNEDAALTAEGIIPGLAFPVRRLFEGLDD